MRIQTTTPTTLRNSLAGTVVTSLYGSNLVATSTRTCTRPEDSDDDPEDPYEPPELLTLNLTEHIQQNAYMIDCDNIPEYDWEPGPAPYDGKWIALTELHIDENLFIRYQGTFLQAFPTTELSRCYNRPIIGTVPINTMQTPTTTQRKDEQIFLKYKWAHRPPGMCTGLIQLVPTL